MNSARLKSQSQVNFESAHVNCDEGEKKGHKLAEILSLAVSCWKSRFIACIKLSSTKHPVGIPKHIASFEEAVEVHQPLAPYAFKLHARAPSARVCNAARRSRASPSATRSGVPGVRRHVHCARGTRLQVLANVAQRRIR